MEIRSQQIQNVLSEQNVFRKISVVACLICPILWWERERERSYRKIALMAVRMAYRPIERTRPQLLSSRPMHIRPDALFESLSLYQSNTHTFCRSSSHFWLHDEGNPGMECFNRQNPRSSFSRKSRPGNWKSVSKEWNNYLNQFRK